MNAIEATGLRKAYGEHVVLDGIDLTVAEGSIFALLGPNGAGKTTIVAILSTLIGADGGELRVAGHDPATEPEAVRAAMKALSSVGGEGGAARTIAANQLEVAVLDRRRVGRTFRRVTGAALTALLDGDAEADTAPAPGRAKTPAVPTEEAKKPTTSAGSADLEGNAEDKPAE